MWRMALTAVLLGLGLMSKSVLVTWPAVFMLMDLWPLRRLDVSRGWRVAAEKGLALLREKIPLLVMAAASCVITLRTGSKSVADLPLGMRLGHVVVSYVRYVGKMFWPTDLAAYYPYEGIGGTPSWAVWHIAGSALILLLITIAAVWMFRTRPYLLVGWLWFLGILVPVIGFVQVGDQGLADRFTYLPSIGVTIAVVWLAGDLLGTRRVGRWIGATLTAAALTALVIATWVYLPTWSNTDVLYRHTLAVTNNNRSVRSFYGDYLYFQSRFDDAIEQYHQQIAFDPADPLPHNKIGRIHSELGRDYEAQQAFEKALALDPNDADAHYNLAVTLTRRGLKEAARQHLEKSIQLNPRGAARYADLRKLLER
jgi:hypothetical protein